MADYHFLSVLEGIIENRKEQPTQGSYTSSLFQAGQDRILRKIGEETAETIVAAKNNDVHELQNEAADLVFHLLVLLHAHNLTFRDVLDTLESRQK